MPSFAALRMTKEEDSFGEPVEVSYDNVVSDIMDSFQAPPEPY
jgi:hypothetical protein